MSKKTPLSFIRFPKALQTLKMQVWFPNREFRSPELQKTNNLSRLKIPASYSR